jgi:hypothetical protein
MIQISFGMNHIPLISSPIDAGIDIMDPCPNESGRTRTSKGPSSIMTKEELEVDDVELSASVRSK